MDRNFNTMQIVIIVVMSLSARRAWIEIIGLTYDGLIASVALRKESVDRNCVVFSLGAKADRVALRKESVDRNSETMLPSWTRYGRSPQGERG